MDLEARKKLWVILSPLADLSTGFGTCSHLAQSEELLHRAGNRCNEVHVAGRQVHKES